MSDDLVKRASYALHDLQGRVEAGKLAMFSKCIDRIEALEAKLAAFADDSNWFDVCEDGQTYAAWRGPAPEPEEFARAALEELKSS